ncbi:MAG: TauD/TfdA family dioxygenase [Actinomycetota bacterium]|nr:TauD/TfdA family dioxygenase [Actinomycetota bacterium]
MTTITTERLSPTVGAMVHGVDRDRMAEDEDLPAWTLEKLEEFGALVFRGLHLDDAAQVAFSRRLGTVEKLGPPPFPEIFRVTLDPSRNRAAPYLKGTFWWHIDGCTDDIPIMATMLSAHDVAETGGETEFASTYQAYEDLADDEKERYDKVRVVHSVEATMRLHTPDPTDEQVAMWRQRPAKEQPLVWTHRSGRKSLVLGATTDHVVGMDAEEGRALLDGLLEQSTRPERVYRHEWEVGDLVLWDNRGVLHRAAPYDPTSPRDMHRTTFAGDEPIQ